MAMTPIARDLLQSFPGLRTSADDADRVAYARDLWPRHLMAVRAGQPAEHRPGAIVWPTSTEQVASLVRWAARRGVALVPFGGGSGVCAGVLPRDGVVVVDLKRLDRVRSLDAGAPLVQVEAGHMGVPLEQTLVRSRLTLGHFPSSILCSTVGGWVATRSAGQCSGAYGKIEDMVVALECVTGQGDVVTLRRRTSAPDLVPIVVGSEGTLAVVTSATLRLHPAPVARGFGAWSFPTTPHGWLATRAIFQAGLRPAVARLYDPFDAVLAKHGGGRKKSRNRSGAPGLGGAALRALLRHPRKLNHLLQSDLFMRAVGGAMLILIFEARDATTAEHDLREAGRLTAASRGTWLGAAPARDWLEHRYSVSYGQAPLFATGIFVDTMEVATKWSTVGAVYDAVRKALGPSALVMAHFSHAYPDGCCIYFSFAGSADPALAGKLGWDRACEATYDRAWKDALSAAIRAGGTLAHHHGVGRSKSRSLPAELGAGVDVMRALMRAFDPVGILNPGNLVPPGSANAAPPSNLAATADETESTEAVLIDHESLLARIDGTTDLAAAERVLNQHNLTLDVRPPSPSPNLAQWLAAGATGARDHWLDPVDQLVAGLDARLTDGRRIHLRPVPRRAVGPDLTALFVGAHGRFGQVERAWLRVHRRGVVRPTSAPFDHERDPAPNAGEDALLDAIARTLSNPSSRTGWS
jgi:alkyldihydroxyacetonephosphate synthase